MKKKFMYCGETEVGGGSEDLFSTWKLKPGKRGLAICEKGKVRMVAHY